MTYHKPVLLNESIKGLDINLMEFMLSNFEDVIIKEPENLKDLFFKKVFFI